MLKVLVHQVDHEVVAADLGDAKLDVGVGVEHLWHVLESQLLISGVLSDVVVVGELLVDEGDELVDQPVVLELFLELMPRLEVGPLDLLGVLAPVLDSNAVG